MAIRAELAMRAAITAEKRLKTADKLLESGDIPTACTLLKRTVLARSAAPEVRATATAKLESIKKQGRSELTQLKQDLRYAQNSTEVQKSLQALFDLKQTHMNTPQLGKEVARATKKMSSDVRIVGILNETRAKGLISLAAECERNGELCCAYLYYEEVAKLESTTSADQAKKKLEGWKYDDEVLDQVASCRSIRECQTEFDRAIRMLEIPKRHNTAIKKLKVIVSKSPRESQVHMAAMDALARSAVSD